MSCYHNDLIIIIYHNLVPLFQRGKGQRENPQAPLCELVSHFKLLFQSKPKSRIPFLPIPFNCEDHDLLLRPCHDSEVLWAIEKGKSKTKTLHGYSPWDLKQVSTELTPHLLNIYNKFMGELYVSKLWLNALVFFLHKGGEKNDPNNYRSIGVEEPFLKVFTTILNARLWDFVEQRDLLPEFQYGFRSNRSAPGAVQLLTEVVRSRKRTFVAFVDFRKAFDFVCRPKLFAKLQLLGVPITFLKLLSIIFNECSFTLQDGNLKSTPISTNNGVMQGDPISPLLFNLFVSDLPEYLEHVGPALGTKEVKYIQYADDLAICADSPVDLQKGLNGLQEFCEKYDLEVNTSKTKFMIFSYPGGLPKLNIKYASTQLERVNEYRYLGVTLSTQLSFSSHIREQCVKARAKAAIIYRKLHMNKMDLGLVLRLFAVYILPVIEYASPIWAFGQKSSPTIDYLNATLTKFLKRYLCVPFRSDNAITHYLCQTTPLYDIVRERSSAFNSSIFHPDCLEGYNFTLLTGEVPAYDPIDKIPSHFWRSKFVFKIPYNPHYRRKIMREIFDSDHYLNCSDNSYHVKAKDQTPNTIPCICTLCHENNHPYHLLYFATKGRLRYFISNK